MSDADIRYALPPAPEPEPQEPVWQGELWRSGEYPPWRSAGDPIPENDFNGEYAHTYRKATSSSGSSWHSPRNEPPKYDTPPRDSHSRKSEPPPRPQPAQQPVYHNKRRFPLWLAIVVGVFALPVGLPLVMAGIAVVVSLIAALFALVFSGFAVAASGIGVIAAGLRALASLPDLLMHLGAGAMLLALGIVLTWLMLRLTVAAFRGLSRLLSRLRGRLV